MTAAMLVLAAGCRMVGGGGPTETQMKRSILTFLVLAVPFTGHAQTNLDNNPWLNPSLRHFATRLDSGETEDVGPGLVEIRAGGSAATSS